MNVSTAFELGSVIKGNNWHSFLQINIYFKNSIEFTFTSNTVVKAPKQLPVTVIQYKIIKEE